MKNKDYVNSATVVNQGAIGVGIHLVDFNDILKMAVRSHHLISNVSAEDRISIDEYVSSKTLLIPEDYSLSPIHLRGHKG